MAWRFLRRLLFGRRPGTPEELIEAVVADMRRKLTEARLQMLAADMARQKLTDPSRADNSTYEMARQGLQKLESTLRELESRRSILIARARDADARLAIERALTETDSQPADVALDLLAERVGETEAEADANAEVRQMSQDDEVNNA